MISSRQQVAEQDSEMTSFQTAAQAWCRCRTDQRSQDTLRGGGGAVVMLARRLPMFLPACRLFTLVFWMGCSHVAVRLQYDLLSRCFRSARAPHLAADPF